VQLRIRAYQTEISAETRAAIERKVRLALGRQAAGIELAQLTLSPGLPQSLGSRCRLRVRLRRGGSLMVEDHAEDPRSAAAAVAERVEHRLERERAIRSATAPSASGRVRLR